MERGEITRIEVAGVVFVDRPDVIQWMHRPRAKADGPVPKGAARREPAAEPIGADPSPLRAQQESIRETIKRRIAQL